LKTPIIINDSTSIDRAGDVGLWEDRADLEEWLEPWAAEEKMLSVFDAEGCRLKIRSNETRVWLEKAEDNPTHQDVLRSVLSEFLKGVGANPSWCDAASLAELVSAAFDKFGHKKSD
jgi:hypothetical protein